MFKLLRYTFRYQSEPGNRIARTSTILAVGVFIIWLVRFALQIRESGDPLFSWDFAFAAAYGLGFILLFGFLLTIKKKPGFCIFLKIPDFSQIVQKIGKSEIVFNFL